MTEQQRTEVYAWIPEGTIFEDPDEYLPAPINNPSTISSTVSDIFSNRSETIATNLNDLHDPANTKISQQTLLNEKGAMVNGRSLPAGGPNMHDLLTGSDTASNVLFGGVQSSVAQLHGLSRETIIAAQAAGSAYGNAIAPANIVLGTSIAGVKGQEGAVLRQTMPWTILVAVLTGLGTIALVLAR